MRIQSIEAIPLKIPFSDLYSGPRHKERGWTHFDTVLVRVTTKDGLVGWGEAFAYSCARSVTAAVNEMIAPLVVGRSIDDIPALNLQLQKDLHIWGRYGITIFALSGLDIALWDIAAKAAGKSLADYLGGRVREAVPAYASLVRYGAPPPIAAVAAQAVAEGYQDVKLHEVTYDNIAAGRSAVGQTIRLTTDVNCHWSVPEAEAVLPRLKALDLFWVEEPIFPPEDYDALKHLGEFGVSLSAGENACTAVEFKRLIEAVAYPQPSVTKVGGISEFLKIAALARIAGKPVMPHSPYFGPGYWGTLQLAAHLEQIGLFEFLYVKPDAWLGQDIPLPKAGQIALPGAPGIGFVPVDETLRRYRID
ncbi:MAG TPA: mandelate racemase/muconate lactonizing enzyme family protein [Ferrovibrio sp.]|uniref:mandelate racemase/muconate lactonizing enzyme family protein n=1 Tax=Ferrovibrio sp. TaxID=1917215 RepID=UPI002ED5261A